MENHRKNNFGFGHQLFPGAIVQTDSGVFPPVVIENGNLGTIEFFAEEIDQPVREIHSVHLVRLQQIQYNRVGNLCQTDFQGFQGKR